MQVQARTYVRYTNRRVNQMKQGLRAGTARKELAKTLSKEWNVEMNPVYQKIHKVAADLKAFKARKKLERANRGKLTESKFVKNELIISHTKNPMVSTINLVKKTDGIELSGDALKVYNKLKKEPTKIVLHDDHVRYYFN